MESFLEFATCLSFNLLSLSSLNYNMQGQNQKLLMGERGVEHQPPGNFKKYILTAVTLACARKCSGHSPYVS